MKRLFFALWPDAGIRRQCRHIMRQIAGPGIRPVNANNLHATLLFLGGVDAQRQAAIDLAADSLPIPNMELAFDRLSFWKKPAILCLTSTNGDPGATALAAQMAEIAVQNGVEIDQRPFQAHITLIRKAPGPVEIGFEPIVWRANAFCLVESCSHPGGVRYQVIQRWNGTPKHAGSSEI